MSSSYDQTESARVATMADQILNEVIGGIRRGSIGTEAVNFIHIKKALILAAKNSRTAMMDALAATELTSSVSSVSSSPQPSVVADVPILDIRDVAASVGVNWDDGVDPNSLEWTRIEYALAGKEYVCEW
jgi:hypothetical protein